MYTDPDMKRYLLVISVFFYLMIYLCILNTISSYQYLWSSSRRGHDKQIENCCSRGCGDVGKIENCRLIFGYQHVQFYLLKSQIELSGGEQLSVKFSRETLWLQIQFLSHINGTSCQHSMRDHWQAQGKDDCGPNLCSPNIYRLREDQKTRIRRTEIGVKGSTFGFPERPERR